MVRRRGIRSLWAAIFVCSCLPLFAEDALNPTTALKSLSLEELSSLQVETVHGASARWTLFPPKLTCKL